MAGAGCYNVGSWEVLDVIIYLQIVQLIISACLIAAILLQVKGQGLGGIFVLLQG